MPAIKKVLIDNLNTHLAEINQSKNQYAIARLGKGKTLFFQTILPLLNEKLRNRIVKILFFEEENFPQTRVLTAVDHKMPGWIKILRPPANLPENTIGELKEGIVLQAVFLDEKHVSFKVNDKVYRNFRLTKNKAVSLAKYQPEDTISIYIHQTQKDGHTIHQVKVK